MNGIAGAVELIEVSPRDGLQNESVPVDTTTKLELIARLLDAGQRRIEVTSFVNPNKVPQMADAEALCERLPHHPDARYAGLVLNQRGYRRARASGRLHEVCLVVCASDSFGQRNQGQTIEQGLAETAAIVRAARADGIASSVTITVAFGCPFEGEIDTARVVGIAQALAEQQPDELVLADTIGVAVPSQVSAVIAAVRERIGNALPMRGHFHNTRNTAIANIVAALQAGVSRFDASVGGVGGCPFAPAATGNVASEDVAYLCQRMGLALSVDLERLNDTARWLGERLGRSLPGMLSRAGGFPPRAAG
ncbi:hydroxymethylglutaryl-CoA lyase [Solimonas terrae]|uniref:Hydroxymethylglutaryl-CoA lyase n=1 Tax=Solimonas terrae TaxID=1396819 RepID=A0A6M2BQD0_9GAMM|nr:hydroxymethylglutaryl-CoA lyase [Solimonas terrae]NGY04283.1 hydroxymethylglutaryl-CoA lyase [Solimonas terrae]